MKQNQCISPRLSKFTSIKVLSPLTESKICFDFMMTSLSTNIKQPFCEIYVACMFTATKYVGDFAFRRALCVLRVNARSELTTSLMRFIIYRGFLECTPPYRPASCFMQCMYWQLARSVTVGHHSLISFQTINRTTPKQFV